MKKTIFFSWQADRPPKNGRNFIEEALKSALGMLRSEAPIDEPVREEIAIDKDTKGVAGMPPIVDTIFKKIDRAAIFVPDLTFVGERHDGRPAPNPNVLIEYGWALKSIGYGRMIAVMNAAYGAPTHESMPFDIRHMRFPISYNCPENAAKETRQTAKEQLAKELAAAIKAIFESEEYSASNPQAPASPEFTPLAPKSSSSRFRDTGSPIGIDDSEIRMVSGAARSDISLVLGAAFWLRIMPAEKQSKIWTIPEIKAAVTANNLRLTQAMSEGYRNFGYVRSGDGWGIYATPLPGEDKSRAVVFGFRSGEVWAIDTYPAQATEAEGMILSPEPYFNAAFQPCIEFVRRLGVIGPLRWQAGLEGINGRYLPAPRSRTGKFGPILNDVVFDEGEVVDGQTANINLSVFFEHIFAECGVARPN